MTNGKYVWKIDSISKIIEELFRSNVLKAGNSKNKPIKKSIEFFNVYEKKTFYSEL